MADGLTTLQSALDSVRSRIAEALAAPKPTYSFEGLSVSHESYLAGLLKAEQDLVAAVIRAEGPTEIRSQGWY